MDCVTLCIRTLVVALCSVMTCRQAPFSVLHTLMVLSEDPVSSRQWLSSTSLLSSSRGGARRQAQVMGRVWPSKVQRFRAVPTSQMMPVLSSATERNLGCEDNFHFSRPNEFPFIMQWDCGA